MGNGGGLLWAAAPRETPQVAKADGVGFDGVAVSGCDDTDLQSPTNSCEAESEAVASNSAGVDPELARIVAAWPTLPHDVKAGILALVDARSMPTHAPAGPFCQARSERLGEQPIARDSPSG